MKQIPKSLSEWLTARGFPHLKLRSLRGNRKQKSKGYVMGSSTSDVADAPATEQPESPSELKGDALDERATELDIEGRSEMTADEKRQAVAEAETAGSPEKVESSELPPEQQEPTTEDLALVAGLCRSNASPGALRVANALDREVESRYDDESATDKPNASG